jgi:molybdopterin molybdotransferase
MISLEDALAAYAKHLRAMSAETIAIADSANRVLAESVTALTDLPRIDQSAMDGYALRAADIETASADAPLYLPITQQIVAGAHECLRPLAAGTAARILTGAPLPPGADTVIPQERVHRTGDQLVFSEAYATNRNIRWRGEELQAGATIARAGQRITPGLLASLINAGLDRVRVHRRPNIRVLITGDEVRPAGSKLAPGEIPDSNGPLVCAMLQRWGSLAPRVDYVMDTEAAVREALSQGLAEADLLITCGGASVGDHDFVVAAAEQLGVQRVFWKVAQKPGKPMFFGVLEQAGRQATLIALPGNPGAVLIGLCLHVQRVLELLQGIAHPAPHWAIGVVTETIEADSQRSRLVRMQMHHDANGVAQLLPLPKQDSHMLSNLESADVLVWIPAGTMRIETGTRLCWMSLPA